jgi:alpha-ribazole phosphatase
MKLWLVRHARPLIASGVCYGASDVPADFVGTQAIANALALALPERVVVTVSPLRRCTSIAVSLNTLRPDLGWVADQRLQEMNFGTWEGQAWDAIDRREIDAWAAGFADWRCGGAESVQGVMKRVGAAWNDAQMGGVETVWITHAGVMRAATLIAKGIRHVDDAAQWPKESIEFGQVQILSD